MQYPQYTKEPNGCLQTLVISRLIIGMLLVPMALIIGAVVTVLLMFYALTISPLLALLVIVVAGSAIFGLARWEARRVAKEIPKDD